MKHKVKVIKRRDFIEKYSTMVYPLFSTEVYKVDNDGDDQWEFIRKQVLVRSLVHIGNNHYLCFSKNELCSFIDLQQCLIALRSQIVHDVNLRVAGVSFYNPEHGKVIYDWDTINSFDIIKVI